MTNKPTKINYRKMAQIAGYWDTHDFSEVWDKATPVKLVFKKPLNEVFSFELDASTYKDVAAIAKKENIDSFTLLHNWAREQIHHYSAQRFVNVHSRFAQCYYRTSVNILLRVLIRYHGAL